MFVVNTSDLAANVNAVDALTLDLSIAFGAGPEDVPVVSEQCAQSRQLRKSLSAAMACKTTYPWYK